MSQTTNEFCRFFLCFCWIMLLQKLTLTDGGDRGSGERIRIRQSKTWELKAVSVGHVAGYPLVICYIAIENDH